MAASDKHAWRWFNVQGVPADYTFPLEDRPGQVPIPICETIPVIDLHKATTSNNITTTTTERLAIIQQIIRAGQQYGFFQVVNHGVSESAMINTFKVYEEFFDMAEEDKKCTAPYNENGWIYTGSSEFAKDGIHLWRDSVKHFCHPLEECMQSWPQKPAQYREVASVYLREIKKLSSIIFDLICEGLGLEVRYLEELSQVQLLVANHYPPCPDPSLTLGLLKHCDPSLITILLQQHISGLQVLNNGKWIRVSPIPNALVVNIGSQLEIISNGKLISAEHRAVTNPDKARTSIAIFINPRPNCVIEPAKVLVDEFNPPLYKPAVYKEYVSTLRATGSRSEATHKPARF